MSVKGEMEPKALRHHGDVWSMKYILARWAYRLAGVGFYNHLCRCRQAPHTVHERKVRLLYNAKCSSKMCSLTCTA